MSALLVREFPTRQLAIKPPKNLGLTSIVLGTEPDGSISCSFQPSDSLQNFQMLSHRPIYGCIGLVSVNSEPFLGLVTEAQKSCELEGNSILIVQKVYFYSVLSSKYDRQTDTLGAGGSTQLGSNAGDEAITHPCAGLMKLLSTGSFYFSYLFDLTKEMRIRKTEPPGNRNVLESSNLMFVWNRNIMSELVRVKNECAEDIVRQDVDCSGVLVVLMQGYVGCETVVISSAKWKLAVISRLSSSRAGTRFNARGVDDDGNVSNFVETEFIIYTSHASVSFIQLRGSIPLFWEQTGVQVGTHKVKLARGPESTIHATRKHFLELAQIYSNVQIVNLLSQNSTSPEFQLSDAYNSMVATLKREEPLSRTLKYHEFDFSAIVQRDRYERLGELAASMRDTLADYSFNVHDSSVDVIVQRQYGVIRTNCLDCLDRTNVVQTLFAKLHLQNWINQLGINLTAYDKDNMESVFNNLWADNGDWLSKIYAGTGALKSSFTRNGKQTVFGFLDDAAKSATRFYVQNFQDKGRQEAIDLLLSAGVMLNSSSNAEFKQEMKRHLTEYSSFSKISALCGTYNLNGRTPQGEDLLGWLQTNSGSTCDIVVIGVQELIKLTPGEYITADTDRLRIIWEGALLKSLNSLSGADYVVLRSIHLVALGIFVFTSRALTSRLREVEVASIKTGLMGMAANKGGIGIRLKVDDTSFAFVTAHFAAGQSAVDERNRDYWTISNGLSFRGAKLLDTDNVFWFGDFNYRIDMDNQIARSKIFNRDYRDLWQNDQLSIQMQNGAAFKDFREGELNFDPTYKYDNGSISYDTSEKQRVPSWTDRVIYRGDFIILQDYGRGEQLMSDHRPVKAVFSVSVARFDQAAKARIHSQLRKRSIGSIPTAASSRSSLSTSNLPPPSTEQVKWWKTHHPREIPSVSGTNPFYDFTPPMKEAGNNRSVPLLIDLEKPLINLMD